MPDIRSIIEYFDKIAPASLSEPWDNDGVMVLPEGTREVRKVALALDASGGLPHFAAEFGADLILTHHPLIFKPLSSIDSSFAKHRTIMALIRRDIPLISLHTRFDAADCGVNRVLAAALGVTVDENMISPAERKGAVYGSVRPDTARNLALRAKELFNPAAITLSNPGKPVSRIGILGGAGKEFLKTALSLGLDLLLTGELPYNDLLEASEDGLSCLCFGHYESEIPVMYALKKILESEFGVEATVYDEKPFTVIV